MVMSRYWVVCSDCYDTVKEVKSFDNKKDALDFMLTLPDYYMVTLRDDLKSRPQSSKF